MIPRLSLRARIFLGAVLWTAGLSIALVIVSTMMMLRYPNYPRILHGTLYRDAALFSTVAALCMVIGFVQVRSGLSSLKHLRSRLARVRDGRERHVTGGYPNEVQPLVDDLNRLLSHREHAVARAVAKAGDLAHGLKTPLAILAQEADRVRAAGQVKLASAIMQQVDRMRRQTDYHLAQARAAASGNTTGARSSVVDSVQALVRTMQRLHADRNLVIEDRVSSDHAVRCEREDLDEMLGNLLDNACKWARGRVAIESVRNDAGVLVTVEDDGPGLASELRESVLQRGVRADEAAPGSGLGLAIVRDLAEIYGGSVSLEGGAGGGLCAKLVLPAA